MEIELLEANGVVTLKPEGEIDLHASPLLRSKLRELAASAAPVLLVDFSGVEYIDSSGLATLVEYVRDAGPSGGKLALFGLKPKVKMVFELVRLNELFTIVESRDEAIAASSIEG